MFLGNFVPSGTPSILPDEDETADDDEEELDDDDDATLATLTPSTLASSSDLSRFSPRGSAGARSPPSISGSMCFLRFFMPCGLHSNCGGGSGKGWGYGELRFQGALTGTRFFKPFQTF